VRDDARLLCPDCGWNASAFRRLSSGMVSNLTRLKEHVAVAHPLEPTPDSPYEPRTFAIGDLVTVTKQPECRGCADLEFATRSGVVIAVDRTMDDPDGVTQWIGAGPDPAIYLRGHYYTVLVDEPLRELGGMTWLMQLVRGTDYWTDEILCAASELETR
jgi:hypothetical protein